MKKIIVFLFVLIILLNSYNDKETIVEEKKIDEIAETKKVSINYNNKKQELDLEDYVLGVVACEMPASFNMEALKAMAVAARTFALYKIETNKNYVLSTTTKDQCYQSIDKMKKKWGSSFNNNYNKIKTAVNETNNQYMTYKDKVIIAFYFSISNGKTENCENVFSQKLDYLKSVDSSWDKDYSYKEKTNKFSEKEFLSKLGIKSNKVKSYKIIKDSSGRASKVIINNNEFKGTKFRQLLSLRSTDVTISVNNGQVSISTKGYGHGVGMSQYGANAMAKNGYKYDEILKHYYNGIKIVN